MIDDAELNLLEEGLGKIEIDFNIHSFYSAGSFGESYVIKRNAPESEP